MEVLSGEEFCLCWGLWKHRNEVLMQNIHKDPLDVMTGVSRFLVESQRTPRGVKLCGMHSA